MSELEVKNHTVKELIGNGRTGGVYRGIQDSLQRDVAIKVMNPKFLAHKPVVEEFLERSRAAASLAHPNIISIYNVDQDDETIYYTMEFMAGGSLDDRLRQDGAMPVSTASRLTLGVARALDVGKKKEQFHGNLKTSKILFMDDGETFKLSGVGLLLGVLAKHSARNPTPFTAPEVIQSERPEDHRADIFALGGLLYAMVAGEEFFEGERDLWKASGSGLKLVRPSEIDSDLPRELDDLILKMMSFDPEDRFQEYEDLYDALEELIEIGKELESKPKKKKKKKKKKKATSVDEPTKKKKKKKAASPSEEDDEEPTSPTSPIAKATKKLGSGKAAAIGTATRANGRNAAEAEAQDQGLPIGSMILALWSLILLCAIAYWFLFMKDKGGEEDETGGVNVAQPTVATTSIPKTGGGQIRPLKLARLENAEERVEEFMEFALEQVASRGSKTVRVASGGVNRIFYRLYRQVKQETARDFDQNNCFDALSKVVSLHDNHAETPRQKEAAQFYFAVVVKQFDKKFASESRAIVAKVRNDQLDAARRAYKDLGDRFGTSRWKEKAQARIARLDQLEEIRSSDGSKDAVAAASAFKGLIGKAASRAKLALRRFDHAKAATAFEGLIKDAPNDELKASAKTQYDAYKLQAEGFERAAQNVTAEAKNKGIKFSEGRIKNADVVGAKPDQLTLKIRGRDGGQIETSIRFVKIEPDRLQETLRKFKLDPQATAGLYVFCVENDLADPAEELKEIALEEGDDAFKESFSAFVEAHSSLKEKGGLMGAVDRYVGGLEAQDLYRRAVTELALGQQSQAELRLTKIIKEFPDSDVAPKAKKLVDSSDEENEIKVDENDLIIEGETNDPESAPGGSGNKLINTSGTGVGKADKLYAEAMTLYKKAAPNMPNWMTHNKAALRKLDQAIKLYVKAAIRDKDNTKLENRIAEAQRIKYNLKKTQRLD